MSCQRSGWPIIVWRGVRIKARRERWSRRRLRKVLCQRNGWSSLSRIGVVRGNAGFEVFDGLLEELGSFCTGPVLLLAAHIQDLRNKRPRVSS